MEATRPVSYEMSDYLGMLRRHWWVVVLLTLVGVTGAAAFARVQPKVYQSATSVLVSPTGVQESNATGGRTNNSINLDTEAQLLVSTDIATAAGHLMKVATPPDQLAANVTVTVPPNTTVLTVTYAAGSPKGAQAGSHAFATAYLQNRQSSAQADLTTQITALDAKVKQFSASLSQLSSRVSQLGSGDPNRADLNSQINTLTSQINALTGRENQLATTTVTAGKIISDAPLPPDPSNPSIPLFLGSGAMVGLLLGLGVAIVRERIDPRVRRAVDVLRRADVALLGQLPKRAKPHFDDVFPPYGTGGRMFNRLRNEVLASLDGEAQVVVVTGASRGVAATLVAANLAAALARAGSEVVLVCAHLPDSLIDTAPATRMLGVAAVPGLSDVLAGKVPLDEAIQRAPRNPWLRVIAPGGTASAAGLLQSQSLRDTVAALRDEAEYVVIEAPSAAASADAQSLASQADAAIIAVELRRTTHAEVIDASEQLRRVGTPLLGAVVLPRLARITDEVPPPPLAGRPLTTVDALEVPEPAEQQPADKVGAGRQPASRGGRRSAMSLRRPSPLRLGTTGTPGPAQVALDLARAADVAADQTVVLQRVDGKVTG
jgi:Mrp family chromosome partitioning ATPase